jgi:hypothetical protein
MRLLPNQSLERDAAKSAAPLSLIRYPQLIERKKEEKTPKIAKMKRYST